MNLEVFLSLFTLMFISLAVYLTAQKIRLPYTVLLVIVGSLLVPLSQLEFFSFITSFKLTPELLFFVFLPILIFESAYHMNIDNISENIRAIGLLAIVGLLISTFFVGGVGYYALKWLGWEVPFFVTCLFGAIISSTDPVAVLALFKEYGAPKRLTLIFEGESLFNDGTSFAVFLVLLDVLIKGYQGVESLWQGLFAFTTMMIGGVLFGLLMGFSFARMIGWVKGNEHLEITLTLLVAHFTFILTEVISEHLHLFGQPLRFSSIIATLVASMIIGNYGRFKMSAGVEEYMEKFWSYFAFLANSLVFILMGLLFAELSIDLHVAIWPIVVIILVVATGRAVSIYPLLGLLNRTGKEEPIPASWMHLLAWGSLRGSLAVIMVLLIPDDVTLPGWKYSFSVKEFIAALTIGSIYFTLLIKATTIGKVMRRLQIDALTDNEEIGYYKSKAVIYEQILRKLDELYLDQQVSAEHYQFLSTTFRERYETALRGYKKRVGESSAVLENILRIYLLSLEKAELKDIFHRHEISEPAYKKVLHMLNVQLDRVERNRPQLNSVTERFPTDTLEIFINLSRRLLFLPAKTLKPEDLYSYYRAQYKLIEKVLEQLEQLGGSALNEVFSDPVLIEKIRGLYLTLRENTRQKMEAVVQDNYALLSRLHDTETDKTLDTLRHDTLKQLHNYEIISDKLYILLKHEAD